MNTRTMPHKILTDHDVLQVIGAHVLAIGLSFTNIELALKIVSLSLAIGYTAWKWVTEYNKRKKEKGNKK